MWFGSVALRTVLAAEALLFLPGLPAWGRIAGASSATQAYLLVLGIFSALALITRLAGKPSTRIWAWGAAVTNLPVFPSLTPVGLILAALLVALERSGRPAQTVAGPKRAGFSWAWVAVPSTIGFAWAGAAQVHRFAQLTELPETSGLVLFAGLWLAMPLCAAVHQAGHWIAGHSAGLDGIDAWSGWADPQPASSRQTGLHGRLLLWTLGGPLASLALGALLIAAMLLSPGSEWAAAGELAGLAAACSLATFWLSILPWKAGGYRSDGALLVILMRRGPTYSRERSLALLTGQWLDGVRPRNWDPVWLRTAAAVPDLSRQHATACALNYLYCLDHGYESSARYWIARVANEFSQARSAVPVRWRVEVAYYLAAGDMSARSVDAPAWRRSAGRGQGATFPALMRTEAALAIARGQATEAMAFIESAERRVLAEHNPGIREFEIDLLDRLRYRIEAGIPPAPVAAASPAPAAIASFGMV